MNTTAPSSPLRHPEPQDVAAFTPVSVVGSMTQKPDALLIIAAIVAIFVLLAILIVVVVLYGRQLRTVHITLHREPVPQDVETGVQLTAWRKLGSQEQLAQPGQREPGSGSVSLDCCVSPRQAGSCTPGLHLPPHGHVGCL